MNSNIQRSVRIWLCFPCSPARWPSPRDLSRLRGRRLGGKRFQLPGETDPGSVDFGRQRV